MLYLGTEHGIYVSFDDGANWQSLKQNLPDTPVHDIKVEARDLVIATHGRGFYIMDDISPLRQWGMQTSSTELTLFKPQDALRGLDRTLAVDYVLKTPAQKVTVEFLDAQGKVIRSFSGTAEDEKKPSGPPSPAELPPAARSEAAGRRGHAPPELGPALQGRDRLPGADHVGGEHARPGGASRQPTRCASRPTARRRRSRSRSRREPHLLADVTDADLQKEFDLAMQVSKKTSQANEAVLLVRGIRPQIKDRASKLDSKTGPTAKALDDLEKNLTVGRDVGLPGEQPERRGPAELPDHAEQQDLGDSGRRRILRRPADRAELRGVPDALGPARRRSSTSSTRRSSRSCRR